MRLRNNILVFALAFEDRFDLLFNRTGPSLVGLGRWGPKRVIWVLLLPCINLLKLGWPVAFELRLAPNFKIVVLPETERASCRIHSVTVEIPVNGHNKQESNARHLHLIIAD